MGDVRRDELPPLMDTTQAAMLLGVTRHCVTDLCNRGDIKAVRIGRVWRINRDALLDRCGMAGKEA